MKDIKDTQEIINITNKAIVQIKDIMQSKNALGIVIGVKKGGCAGMEYTISLAFKKISNVDLIEKDGARIFIMHDALLFLLGTEVDFETTEFRVGFVFHNPNQVISCGCGQSFNIIPTSKNLLDNYC